MPERKAGEAGGTHAQPARPTGDRREQGDGVEARLREEGVPDPHRVEQTGRFRAVREVE
jgi:hypothetical protein